MEQASNIKHQASNIKHQASNIKHQASNIKHQASNIKHQTSSIKHQASSIKDQGWKKQMTYDEPRLSEIVRMYEELDFEVHLEPFHPDQAEGCSECMKASPERYKTVYTRKLH